MGTCVSQQTSHSEKPEECNEAPEAYTNTDAYFIAQIVALITHETYDISDNISETLLLTHVFYAESIDLLTAIRDRFFITFERYKFTTYQRECDTIRHTKRNTMAKRQINSAPLHSNSLSVSHPIDPTPPSDDDDDETEHKNRYKSLQRIRVDTTDIEYIPIDTKPLDFKDWIVEVKMVIQRKCLDLLLQWIQNYWVQDFNHQQEEIMPLLTQFIKDIKTSRDQFQGLMQTQDTKRKKKRRKTQRDESQQNYHSIYASFLIPYILKLDNVIATQQSWYQPIVEKLRNKQALQQKLYNEQIQKSKRHKVNRLNSKAMTHQRCSSVNSVSAFSDNIFSDDVCEDNEEEMSGDETMDNVSSMLDFIAMKNRQNAEEYAKQLTLLDWELFNVINARICLYKIRTKQATKEWLSLKVFIDRFQQTHQYVIVSIIGAAPDLKSRIEMIEFFIFVADTLLMIHNLYSFMAVMTALDSVSVQKLRVAWELVGKALKDKYIQRLSPLCSPNNNYKALRDYTQGMKAPAIPFLALLLKDLTFINDGHKDRLSPELDQHINFTKYLMFYRVLSDNIDRFQSKTYCHRMRHSKQFESQDINGLVQQLVVIMSEEEEEDDDAEEEDKCDEDTHIDMDIIPDMELQQNILKDLNVYIVLGRDVIRAMTNEANRADSLKRKQYILQYVNVETRMEENEEKPSKITNAIRNLFTSSHQNTNALNALTE